MTILWLLSRNIQHKRKTVTLNGKKLSALISDTPRLMTVGLMFRAKLEKNECMLFLFPRSGSHPIWMHNMKFPIDIVWLDEKKRVVWMERNAKPLRWFKFNSYNPDVNARYVLEMNAGLAKTLKVNLGTRIHW